MGKKTVKLDDDQYQRLMEILGPSFEELHGDTAALISDTGKLVGEVPIIWNGNKAKVNFAPTWGNGTYVAVVSMYQGRVKHIAEMPPVVLTLYSSYTIDLEFHE